MKRFFHVLLGIAVVACGAATVASTDPYLLLTNNTSTPYVAAVPTGKAAFFLENGTAKLKVGTSVTTIGSGAGGTSEWRQIWPPTNISNPTVGMKTRGPVIAAYLPDSVFQAAEYTPNGWLYTNYKKSPF